MIKLNRAMIKDKIHACWLGKNIGGTIGTPFEGKRELLDVKGFTSEKGEPLPNDDLDLQLIWLCAMEEVGPENLTARELGEYWINYIPPHWNEYGIGKANMKAGLLPPLSGEYCNEKWRHSNGAWIRSEIWACLAPGYPQVARRYAFEDACVDHGMGEGTVAEQFTATMESLAFFNSDIRAILEEALAAIPAESRVAKAVRYVMEEYDKGTDWKDVRNGLVEQSADIGWFQAPANVGFVVLGLLYGEGDFKKSIIYAVNCGDDTDCTGATVGAFLGILYGTAGVPADWAEYIGDGITTISVDRSYRNVAALKNCSVLTERVMAMIPSVLRANGCYCEYTDGESELDDLKGIVVSASRKLYRWNYDAQPLLRARYNFDAFSNAVLRVVVEYDRNPQIKAGEQLQVTLVCVNKLPDPHLVDIKLHLPEGLEADRCGGRLYMDHRRPEGDRFTFTLTATEGLQAMNRVLVEATVVGRPMPILISVPVMG
ncbi:MAG: ADP-ribosylglycohydrolase family protein [Clostridia bacterium]|nr:ADP-ribosylglycohydrolase family protein [Clostridia bacterium]